MLNGSVVVNTADLPMINVCRMSGLSHRDKVRKGMGSEHSSYSSTLKGGSWCGSGISPGCVLDMSYQEDPRHNEGNYISYQAWEQLEEEPGGTGEDRWRKMCGLLCSDRCPHDPEPNKKQKMDVWTEPKFLSWLSIWPNVTTPQLWPWLMARKMFLQKIITQQWRKPLTHSAI